MLLVSNLNTSSDSDQSISAAEKILVINQKIITDLAQECDFVKATTIDQTKHLLKLVEAADSTASILHDLKKVHSDFSAALIGIQAVTSTLSSLGEHIQSLSISAKSPVTVSNVLCEVPMPTGHPAPHTYADIAGRQANPAASTPYSPDPPNAPTTLGPNQPNHILQITNHLSITEKQLYITFDPTDGQAPKAKDGSAVLQLHTKLNMLLKSLPSSLNVSPALTTTESSLTIHALCLTNNNTTLLEFESADAVMGFKVLNVEHRFLTVHMCPLVAICPHSLCIILHFMLCNGSFDPYDSDHLSQIKEDMNLPSHSIMSAAWIKKPELRAPSQQTANVKLLCTLAKAANKLLREHLFISNV